MKRIALVVVLDVVDEAPPEEVANGLRGWLSIFHPHVDHTLVPALAAVCNGINEREESIYHGTNAEDVQREADALVEWTEKVGRD